MWDLRDVRATLCTLKESTSLFSASNFKIYNLENFLSSSPHLFPFGVLGFWGLEWQPKRWGREGLDVVRTVEYIPFGGKVGRPAEISMCPSRIRGGPKLIALIVGALLGLLGEGWELVESRDGRDDVSGNKPLRKGMDAYETLSLCHNSVGGY